MEKEILYNKIFSEKKYEVIVLDMDGTLYYQRGMQILMFLEMGAFAITHPFSMWKLRVISAFRKVRELEMFSEDSYDIEKSDFDDMENSLLNLQYKITAERMNVKAQEVKVIVEEWMFKRPLRYLNYVCDDKLCRWVDAWKKAGKSIVVYSDYPVTEKCDILGVKADAMYCSGEGTIGRMKPSACGLKVISRELSVMPDKILVVGDRMSKDGKMAEAFGCDYVILKKWKFLRNKKY